MLLHFSVQRKCRYFGSFGLEFGIASFKTLCLLMFVLIMCEDSISLQPGPLKSSEDSRNSPFKIRSVLGLDVKVQAFAKDLSSSVYQAGVAVKLIYLLLFSMFRVFATLYILVECTSDLIKYEKASGLKVHHTEVAVIVKNLFKFVATCST